MDTEERLFRGTPVNSQKYPNRLIKYIEHLISNNRIIEAKYFFEILYQNKPNHLKTIKLGYQISIATFDNDGVKKFDRQLFDLQTKSNDVFYFRFCYYFSVHNIDAMEECALILLKRNIGDEQLTVIVQACLQYKKFAMAKALCAYFKRKKIFPNQGTEKKLRQILLQKFVTLLIESKYEKIPDR